MIVTGPVRIAWPHVTQTFNVIAADVNTARLIACKIAQGSIPDLYATPGAALAAWRAYPIPMHSRYHPWAVSLYTGKSDDLTKRL